MPGRWSDERERGWDERRGDGDRRVRPEWQGGEARSFDDGDDDARYARTDHGTYDRGAGGRDRYERNERVFGERDSGAGYNAPRDERRFTDYRGSDLRGRGGSDWQARDYQGVSPAFRGHEHDYDSGYRAYSRGQRQDPARGGRFYGDDGRERVFRGEYAYGGGQEGRRFGSREADERYQRAIGRDRAFGGGGRYGTWSGGTGGYDYERGYGDGGRGDGHRDFEDRAREAGDFLRRAGQRVANWFNDLGEGSDMGRDENRGREENRARDEARADSRRGLGPKGYKRSDDRIADDANQRLTDDPWLDASDVDVAVSGGEVTLTGSVDSREAKHRAESLVEHLSGVQHVQNNLRVKTVGGFTTSGRGYSNISSEQYQRSEGDAASETSANATGTTTRPKA